MTKVKELMLFYFIWHFLPEKYIESINLFISHMILSLTSWNIKWPEPSPQRTTMWDVARYLTNGRWINNVRRGWFFFSKHAFKCWGRIYTLINILFCLINFSDIRCFSQVINTKLLSWHYFNLVYYNGDIHRPNQALGDELSCGSING